MNVEKDYIDSIRSGRDAKSILDQYFEENEPDFDLLNALGSYSSNGGWVDDDAEIVIVVTEVKEILEDNLRFDIRASFTELTYGGCPDMPHRSNAVCDVSGVLSLSDGGIDWRHHEF
ncbi:MAG: hypothetical protein ACYDDP_02680 [Acidithiobacillus sp.]